MGDKLALSILGSGWLGLPLARSLAADHGPVNLSTTRAERLDELRGPGIRPFVIDITRPIDELATFLDTETLIINITSKNVEAFTDLVLAIRQSAVRRVLFISSTSVYPDMPDPISEDMGVEDETHPLWRIEQLLRNESALQTTVIRFAGLVGGGRHPGRFFGGGRAVPNPVGQVNLIHRDDCIAIIRRIIELHAWGRVFNACADEHPPRFAFYRHCAQLAGLPEPVAGQGDGLKVISSERLKSELGYSFIYPDPMRMPFD